jgi:hypothetical protein
MEKTFSNLKGRLGMLIKRLSLLILFGTLFSAMANAATYNAASCSESDVQSAVNLTSNGDTVNIPACSQTNWGSNSTNDVSLNVNTAITIQGAGQGSTIIGDNLYKGNPSTCASKQPLINWTVSGTTPFRLTGVSIVGIATDTGVCQAGHIHISGSNHYMEIDHVTIDPGQTVMIYIYGDIWGVITTSSFTGNFVDGVRVEAPGWNGSSDLWGDASWNTAVSYGGGQGVYIENNTFTSTASAGVGGATDCFSGGQLVFRYNTVSMYNNQSHGADSDQRHRGCRWQEIYNNTYSYSNINELAFISWIRGGTGVVYNNTITASGYTNNVVQVANCRDASAGCGAGGPNYTPWGACNGSGAYDENSTSAGHRCVDQPGAGTSCLLGPDSGGTTVTVAACSYNNNAAGAWTGNQSDPIYVWNNTLNGASDNQAAGSTNVVANRDYYVGTARPGYTAYTYPYPVNSSSAPNPPANLQAVVH